MSELKNLYSRAVRFLPGGVNSPVRAFNSVSGTPFFTSSAKGAHLHTSDNRTLIDFCCGWGPMILGHAHPEVVEASKKAMESGSTPGTNTAMEGELAELICTANSPDLEKIRFMNSGTEAVMTAIRLARAFTGRAKIIKFSGCYHGHSDAMLASAGSGVLSLGIPSSAGVPAEVTADTLCLDYNNAEQVEAAFARFPDKIAAVIVEPVAGNMGLVLPEAGFLQQLRNSTSRFGACLIFDEVITAFRFGPSTYGRICGITPDLTCLGKIIGGGMPIGAVAGPTRIMDMLAPMGPVYQAGTLSGNPVSMAAGLATLKILLKQNPYGQLAELGRMMADVLKSIQKDHPSFNFTSLGSTFTVFFSREAVTDYATARLCDTSRYAKFFHHMLSSGIFLPPSQFETCFISTAHTEKDISAFLSAFDAYTRLLV